MKPRVLESLVVGVALAVQLGSAGASLVGEGVSGTLTAPGGVNTQFTSPATVGAAVEFSGQVHEPAFNDDFDIDADFTANALLLTVTYVGTALGGTQGNLFEADFVFAGNPNISDVVASLSNPVGGVSGVSFGPNSINIDFLDVFSFRLAPQTWQFDITQRQAVPAPATLALVSLGLVGLGLGAAGRRRAR